MFEGRERREESKQIGYYYITDGVDLLWSDGVEEWRMSTSAQDMKSSIELDKADRELEKLGYQINMKEFCLDPNKYKLEQIKHMNPLELEKLRSL